MSKIGKIVLITAVIIVLGGIFFTLHLVTQVNTPNSDSEGTVFFTVESGQGVNEISSNLAEAGLIKSRLALETYLWFSRLESSLKAGEYTIPQNLSIRELVNILVQGSNSREKNIKIIEGWKISDIAKYLAEEGLVDEDDFIRAASVHDSREIISGKSYDFLADRSPLADLEGYLFPDTYRVFKDTDSAKIIEKMLDNFELKLNEELRREIDNQSKTIFEIVTLASILEKELQTYEDRRMAADLFYRRIEAGIPMQSDATVNYVTGKSLLQPSYQDTRKESPYNTYLNKGLPPGPICNPSLSAIKAAIYPLANDYFYYLHKPDGTTIFSRTLEEHNTNKFKYLN